MRPLERLDGLRAEFPLWRELLKCAPVDPLCNSPEWLLAHAESYGDADSYFGWAMEEPDGKPVAMVALRREPRRHPLALRRAIFASAGTFDSDYLDFPCRPGFEKAIADSLLEGLTARHDVDVLVLTGVPRDSPMLGALRRLAVERRLPIREVDVTCLAAPLPETFDDYLKGLKPRVRSKVRSALRNAEERGASFAWCSEAEKLGEHLEGLYALHAMRWNAEGRPGSFADERRRRFYELLSAELLSQGRLRFARLEIGGRPVAYQIGALARSTYYQIQEGFHTDFADLRVGTALRAWVVRLLIEEGVRSYDFMEGASRHKEEWGGTLRPCSTVAIVLPRLRARFAYWVRTIVDRWRPADSSH